MKKKYHCFYLIKRSHKSATKQYEVESEDALVSEFLDDALESKSERYAKCSDYKKHFSSGI